MTMFASFYTERLNNILFRRTGRLAAASLIFAVPTSTVVQVASADLKGEMSIMKFRKNGNFQSVIALNQQLIDGGRVLHLFSLSLFIKLSFQLLMTMMIFWCLLGMTLPPSMESVSRYFLVLLMGRK